MMFINNCYYKVHLHTLRQTKKNLKSLTISEFYFTNKMPRFLLEVLKVIQKFPILAYWKTLL